MQTWSRTATIARDTKKYWLIDAPRQSAINKTLARDNHRGNHHCAATLTRHPDCRALPTQIVAP